MKYRTRNGALISGVCAGRSKETGKNVWFYRLLYLIGAIYGIGFIIYLWASITRPLQEELEELKLLKFPKVEEAPEEVINRKLLKKYLKEIGLGEKEQIFSFLETFTRVKHEGVIGLVNYFMMVTDERILLWTKDVAEVIFKQDYTYEQINGITLDDGLSSSKITLRLVTDEQIIINVPGIHVQCIVDYIKKQPSVIRGMEAVKKKEEELARIEQEKLDKYNAEIQSYIDQWEEKKESILTRLPDLLETGQEVTLGYRHPDFDSFIESQLDIDETILVRCYSGEEVMVLTDEKAILLKTGSAKAALVKTGEYGDALLSGSIVAVAGTFLYNKLVTEIEKEGVLVRTVNYNVITFIDGTGTKIAFNFPGSKEELAEYTFNYIEELKDYIQPIVRHLKKIVNSNSRAKQVNKSESIPEQIEKLAKLKETGILTEEEFQRKKQELLDKM